MPSELTVKVPVVVKEPVTGTVGQPKLDSETSMSPVIFKQEDITVQVPTALPPQAATLLQLPPLPIAPPVVLAPPIVLAPPTLLVPPLELPAVGTVPAPALPLLLAPLPQAVPAAASTNPLRNPRCPFRINDLSEPRTTASSFARSFAQTSHFARRNQRFWALVCLVMSDSLTGES